MHFTFSIRIPFPFGAILYRAEGQVLTDIRIPFITFAYFMFLWTCITLSYVFWAFVILTFIAMAMSSVRTATDR